MNFPGSGPVLIKAARLRAIVALSALLMIFDVHGADLLQVYGQALLNDPTYAGARASLQAGAEKSIQARAGLLPNVALAAGVSQVNQEFAQFGSLGYRNNNYNLSLAQPVFRLANWAAYQQGKLSVAVSEAQFAQARQDLMLRVAQSYFDVLASQDTLAFIRAQQAAITEQLASAKRNFEVGTATITDTNEAQARFDLAASQQIAAESDLDIKRAVLQQIIGDVPSALAPLRAGVRLTAPLPAQMDQWVASAEQQNFSVIVQQLSLEIAQQQIKIERAGHAPTVDLVASRGRAKQGTSVLTGFNGAGGDITTNSVGLQISIPLFSGFAVSSRVRESIAQEDRARSDLVLSKRTAAQNARQYFLGVNNGLSQVKALEAAEISSQSALDSNRLGYQVGVRINIDVLNAQQQLTSTQRDLSRARYDTVLNGLRLKAAAGTLQEDDFIKINSLLDATFR